MTEQEKREKVIKGLECCLGKGQKRGMCEDCPYNTGRMKCNLGDMHVGALALLKAQEPPTSTSISSAIECLLHPQDADDSDMAKAIDTAVRAMRLLKAQEPRVMTLEEVNALDWDYCYLEQERLPGKEYRGMLGKYIMTCVTWPSITGAKISRGKDSYGKTWRCWTSRPSDAVRRMTKWE